MPWLTNVRLPDPVLTTSQTNVWRIQLNQNQIIQSISQISDQCDIPGEDWKGAFLSPMAVDLQINGGLGLAFPELTFKDLPKLFSLLDILWKDGVEAIAPTLVTCSISALRQSLLVLREARKDHIRNRCKLLGAHLEGPFLAREFLGAHNEQYLASPSLEELDIRISDFENEISLITLAPELKGSNKLIKRLRELDIVVSLGHSSANAEISNAAFNQGVSMLTHVFNAMSPMHHRFPGPIVEAITHGSISLGLIADGVHIHPKVVILLHRLAAEQLVLVSDAISPYGLGNGKYPWDKRFIISNDGCCRLLNGTLAGSTVPLLDGCKKLAKWTGQEASAIWSATISPRQVLSGRKLTNEEIYIGKPINQLLRWETNSDNKQLFWRMAA